MAGRLLTATKSLCALYDFNTDGGAIGSIDLQVPFPANAVPVSISLKCLAAFNPERANFSVGLRQTGQNPDIDFPVFFFPVQDPAVFSGPGLVLSQKFADLVDTTDNPVNAGLGSGTVVFYISAHSISAGSLAIFVEYFESQF